MPIEEERMGAWVTARCQKCVEEIHESMPHDVMDWLDNGGNSPANGNTAPTGEVMDCLVKTIEDAHWPAR